MPVLILSIIGLIISSLLILKYRSKILLLEKLILGLLGLSFLCVILSYFEVSKKLYLSYLILLIISVTGILYSESRYKQKTPMIIAFVWLLTLFIQLLNLPYWGLALIIKSVVFIVLSLLVFFKSNFKKNTFTRAWLILGVTNLLVDIFNYFG